MVWEELIFVDQNTDSLFEAGAFKTKYVSKVGTGLLKIISIDSKIMTRVAVVFLTG